MNDEPGMNNQTSKTAIVTGASSGIGAAASRQLVAAGYDVYMGARRLDKLNDLAQEIGAHALALDVTDPESVNAFAASVPKSVHVLVNNAGGAFGLEPIAEFSETNWRAMYETNVLGLARVTRTFHPHLLHAEPVGHVVNIGSIAAIETYIGGAGYSACKHGVRAVTETLRLEWLGQTLRVTEIDPGLVETEFSMVRFSGDARRASQVYAGMKPLSAEDVAEAIVWAVSRPPHVNIDHILIRPLDQARADKVNRRT